MSFDMDTVWIRRIAALAVVMAACNAADDAAQPLAGAGGLGGAGGAGAAGGAGGGVPDPGGSGGAGGVAGVAMGGVGGGLGGAGGAGGVAGAGSGSGGMSASAGGEGGLAGGGELDSGIADAGAEHEPVPSDGCGKSGRPSGGLVDVAGSHSYWFPESYDGSTPLPLIMAFHAAGNGNDQLRNITKDSALAQHFVMAFPKSLGNGWSLDADAPRIDERIEELFDSHCIDTSRVFATGHSSGAQLIVQLLCRGDDRYFAIAPVASSAYCPSWAPAIPALIIHGVDDRERAKTNQDADGRKDLAPYLSSSGCSMDSDPYEQAGCSSSGTNVAPGCVQFEGCSAPTIWCHHDDPQYGTTNHGWPCFANDAIDRFFRGLM